MGKSYDWIVCRDLLFGLATIAVLVGFSAPAQAQWSGTEISCTPSGGGVITLDNVSPATGSSATKDFSVNVGCRSWHVSDPGTNRVSGGYCIGIPTVGSETPDRRRAYLDGVVGNPYIEFQFIYTQGGASYIGAGDGSGGWGAVNYGFSSGSPTPPIPGIGFDLGTNNEKLSVYVPGGQSLPSLMAGTYISEAYSMQLWSGTSDGDDFGYLADENNWRNCWQSFPNSFGISAGEIVVEINVERSCTLSASQTVDFGEITSFNVVSGSVPVATGKIGVDCNTADSYRIKIDGGQSGDPYDRFMKLGGPGGGGAAPTIRYQLYHAPGTVNVWGDEGDNVHTDPGFLGLKTFQVNAVIPQQSGPAATGGVFPSGIYSDIVKIILDVAPTP